MALSPKQEQFCREYLIDLNATQAAIRAGYSKRTAESLGSRLLRNVKVKERIEELKNEREDRVQVNADYVLRRLVQIDQMDALDILNPDHSLKPITEWPLVWRQYVSGFDLIEIDEKAILKKIKWPDKVKNLELLGKHVGVQAFKDKIDVEGNLTVGLADSLRAAREAREKGDA